jgi:glucose-1-phosphate adenylyltransferase
MLDDGCRMTANTFSGYWKDVGTIASLWEANMDLLNDRPEIDLHDKQWRIYARNEGYLPQYIAQGAELSRCLITEGCQIEGTVTHSIVSTNAIVEKGAQVIDSVLMPGVHVKSGARVVRSIIAEKYGEAVADDTTILYGGSCKASNAPELFAKPDIDGGLIGGASLKAADFKGIIDAWK